MNIKLSRDCPVRDCVGMVYEIVAKEGVSYGCDEGHEIDSRDLEDEVCRGCNAPVMHCGCDRLYEEYRDRYL